MNKPSLPAPPACSHFAACFPTLPRATYPGMHHHPALNSNEENTTTGMSIGKSDGGNFSIETLVFPCMSGFVSSGQC